MSEQEKADKYVLTLEQAEEEFRDWLEAMDIVFEPAEMDEESRDDFNQHKRCVLRAIRTGHVVISGEELRLHPKSKNDKGELIREKPLVFVEPEGANITAMDDVKRGDVKKMFSTFASVTKTDIALMNRLKERDLRVVRSIMQLFLAAR